MTSLPPPGAGTLHGLFEAHVRQSPDRPALIGDGQILTYAVVNQAANKIAHYLRDGCGVGPDDAVAILVRPPLMSVIAILAALKAGGAYVPLDPDNPPAATNQILDRIAPKAVLLDSSAAAVAAFFDGEIFVMDVMASALQTPATDPSPFTTPRHLAYIMLTSGTTGTPKGVAVEHHSIMNTVRWRGGYYELGPHAVALGIARHSFDSSVTDIFSMLTCGGSLVLPDRDRITDRRYLVELITSHAISHFTITPALYRRLLGGLNAGAAPSLRSVTVAGEWFTGDLVQAHYGRLPDVALYNEYGPAENSVCSTATLLAAGDPCVLIGRPVDNTAAFVVKDDETLAEVGDTGELFLAGEGLARGYFGDPDLTAEKFPVWRTPDGQPLRIYRSGDIVRLHEAGNLQFVGRRDRQVKIRGRRVELDHVTACLMADPQVSDVSVLHYLAPSGTPYLLAFVVGPACDPDRLHATARDSLAAYMVPSMIIPVDEIPLTRSGKVDEDALLAIYFDLIAGGGSARRANSAYESSLLALWQRLFPQFTIGLDHDFFDLGGDSLLAMDLAASIEEFFGIQLETSAIYESRSVRNLALLMDRSRVRGGS